MRLWCDDDAMTVRWRRDDDAMMIRVESHTWCDDGDDAMMMRWWLDGNAMMMMEMRWRCDGDAMTKRWWCDEVLHLHDNKLLIIMMMTFRGLIVPPVRYGNYFDDCGRYLRWVARTNNAFFCPARPMDISDHSFWCGGSAATEEPCYYGYFRDHWISCSVGEMCPRSQLRAGHGCRQIRGHYGSKRKEGWTSLPATTRGRHSPSAINTMCDGLDSMPRAD